MPSNQGQLRLAGWQRASLCLSICASIRRALHHPRLCAEMYIRICLSFHPSSGITHLPPMCSSVCLSMHLPSIYVANELSVRGLSPAYAPRHAGARPPVHLGTHAPIWPPCVKAVTHLQYESRVHIHGAQVDVDINRKQSGAEGRLSLTTGPTWTFLRKYFAPFCPAETAINKRISADGASQTSTSSPKTNGPGLSR